MTVSLGAGDEIILELSKDIGPGEPYRPVIATSVVVRDLEGRLYVMHTPNGCSKTYISQEALASMTAMSMSRGGSV